MDGEGLDFDLHPVEQGKGRRPLQVTELHLQAFEYVDVGIHGRNEVPAGLKLKEFELLERQDLHAGPDQLDAHL